MGGTTHGWVWVKDMRSVRFSRLRLDFGLAQPVARERGRDFYKLEEFRINICVVFLFSYSAYKRKIRRRRYRMKKVGVCGEER